MRPQQLKCLCWGKWLGLSENTGNQLKKEGRKLVTACSTQNWLPGIVWDTALPVITLAREWAGQRLLRVTKHVCFLPYVFASFAMFLCLPAGRSIVQRSGTSGLIYRPIFSPSRAQLYLTNMSSSPARVVQWSGKMKNGVVQWEWARGEEGAGYTTAYHLQWNRHEAMRAEATEKERPLTLLLFQCVCPNNFLRQ